MDVHIQINISKIDGDSKSSSSLEVRSTPEAVLYVKDFKLAKDCIAMSIS